ncbi:polysaccharide biosynthesis protein [Actinomycetospora sp. CA-101289]|uniref:polysaccharide biosynthesis protein n=1 Tax=Actinomycetospora sp. CA-101289 TaxID=3239893 RepID=UPI003D95D5FC
MDCAFWFPALLISEVMRGQTDLGQMPHEGVERVWLVAVAAQLLLGTALHLYRGWYCTGALDEVLRVGAAVGSTGIVVFVVNLVPGTPWVPRSVPLIAALLVGALAVGARTAVRLRRERTLRPDRQCAQRVIVLGAGVDGQQLVRAMLSDASSGYLPVALLDDDPDVRLRRVLGVTVRGTRADLGQVAAATDADLLVVADRALDASTVREIALSAVDAGLAVKVLPPLPERLRTWSTPSDLQDLDISELLGRRPVDIDLAAVAHYLEGRRVLVTGAGGSIGSELCRQIHGFGPGALLMLDRDESALHGTQLSIFGTALLDTPDVILADIRDAPTVSRLFLEHRPDVVFHAAALKHLPLLEQYPGEAWETNVVGTRNVLDAAQLAGVDRFVNISTDKAADPVSVLGRSKRIGERFVSHVAADNSGTFLSVRFGNVLGSRGSVLTTFADQISNGSPVTVTDPDVTRFFMTIPEAVQLVIYAAAIGSPGEVLVLDMGEPVRIADVARQLMGIAGRTVEIVYTGLRHGEKLHEQLLGQYEPDRRPIHPSVSQIEVPSLDPDQAQVTARSLGAAAALVHLTEPEHDLRGAVDGAVPLPRQALRTGGDRS